MAHQTRNARPEGSGPLLVVGMTSKRSKEFVQGTGYYEQVLAYDEVVSSPGNGASALGQSLSSLSSLERIVLIECGSPSNTVLALMTQPLPSLTKASVSLIAVGGEAKEQSATEILAGMGKAAEMGVTQLNTSPLKERAVERIGEAEYYKLLEREWRQFRANGGIPGLDLRWNEGLEGPGGAEGCWERLVKGEIDGRWGDVCKL